MKSDEYLVSMAELMRKTSVLEDLSAGGKGGRQNCWKNNVFE